MRDVKQISGALCNEHLTGAFPEVSVNDNYSALWHVREKNVRKIYTLSPDSLSLVKLFIMRLLTESRCASTNVKRD